MNVKQRNYLMIDLWPMACRTQHWKVSDRELRLRVLGEAIGRPIKSANDLNGTNDFDRVKAHLKALADSVQGAIEVDNPEMGKARRLRERISEVMRCIALYVADPDGYLREVIKDGMHGGRRHECPALEDLDARPRFRGSREMPSQLEQLLMTLSARLNGKTGLRNKAGDSLHDMRIKAGLECACRLCRPRVVVRVDEAPAAPVADADDTGLVHHLSTGAEDNEPW